MAVKKKSTYKRDRKILSLLKKGGTLRGIAAVVGVHHKTVQNVGDRNEVYSVRSELNS